MQILHIAHKIAFCIDHLIDRLLPPLILIRHAVYDLFGHRMYPWHSRLNDMFQVAQALTDKLVFNPQPRLRFHVQMTLLLEPPCTRDSVTQMVSAACQRIAVSQERKYPCRQ